MSKMNEYLSKIMSARYGKDVRQSIHDGIKELDEVARTAQGSATLSAQTAIDKANEALAASQEAIESAKQAKAYSDNAQAVAGVTVATKDTAGLVKGGENHIALDGTLELIVRTTEASMPNSRKGRVKLDEIGGVCVQDNIPTPDYPQEIRAVKGKNLLDCRGLTEQTVNGVTFTPVYDDNGNLLYVEANGTASGTATYILNDDFNIPNGEYTLSSGATLGNVYVNRHNRSSLAYDSTVASEGGTFDTSSWDYAAYIYRVVWQTTNGSTAESAKIYPMIRPASVADATYVPYGLLRVKTRGKNLLKKTAVSATNNGITYTVNKDGTITCNGTATANSTFFWYQDKIKKGEYLLSGGFIDTEGKIRLVAKFGDKYCTYYAGNDIAASLDADCNSYSCYISITSGITVNNLVIYPMLRSADIEDATYAPYQESSITLSEPIELCGIGDVQDIVDVENGVVRRRIGEYTVTSENNINVYNNYPSINIENVKNYGTSDVSVTDILTMSNYFAGASWGKNSLETVFPYWGESRISFKTAMSATELKEFVADKELEGNPLKVYFVLAEETTEPLPIADRIALNSLLTFEGATYLEFDSAVEPTIEAEYGTSKVGGYALEGLLVARNNEIRLNALETA